jgi:signal transduction histidine kinase
LRIDDRLETALASAESQADGNLTGTWRQLVDVLAQTTGNADPQQVANGLAIVHRMSPQVAVNVRAAGIRALAGRLKSPPLIQLFTRDDPEIASAAIGAAQLSDDDWSDLVPELPVRARGFLRARADLGPKTQRALQNWAGADFRLSGNIAKADTPIIKPAMIAPADQVAETQSQIGALVQRIEEWRRNREATDSPRLPLGDDGADNQAADIDEIQFETDDNGTIVWVEGAPRGAIVGTDIARASFDDGPGPDAYGAAAFRQRMPMGNARMLLRGGPSIDGDWRMTAAPFFDQLTGRFRGFRGLMRRPNIVEKPYDEGDDSLARRLQAESMQQIVHELRTPLGAIAGFAEIIEQQLFGPVADDYRGMASAILEDARRLLSGFEDMSTAARLDAGNLEIEDGTTECDWLADRLKDRLAPISDELGVMVNISLADPVRPFALEREMAERIFSRLLSAIIMGGGKGEVLRGRFRTELGRNATNSFRLDLPEKLTDLNEEDLLGSIPAIEEQMADKAASPLLGLGFSLRLVRNLARKVGGDLRFHKESLLLILPATQNHDLTIRDIGGD